MLSVSRKQGESLVVHTSGGEVLGTLTFCFRRGRRKQVKVLVEGERLRVVRGEKTLGEIVGEVVTRADDESKTTATGENFSGDLLDTTPDSCLDSSA